MHISRLASSLILLLVITTGLLAQTETPKKDKNLEFKPVPYINYSRTGGFFIGAVPMAMFRANKNDTISPKSMAGLAGVYSTEGNWASVVFSKIFLNEDRWRFTGGGGVGMNGFQFYMDDISEFVDYTTDIDFLMVKAERRIYKNLFAGLRYAYRKTETNTAISPDPDETTFNSLAISFSNDERDNVYYPFSGSILDINFNTTPEFFDNEFVTQKIEINFNKFLAIKETDVLALRGKLGIGIGDLAFEQQFIVGQLDIRGYTEGKYRGNNIATLQGEYRWNFRERMGIVGFAGLATIWESINSADNGKLLPGVGAGFRFTAFPDNHLNIGLDAAVGDGDWGIYFRIGESF